MTHQGPPLRYSIIVPTHNRAAALLRTLDALERLRYDPEQYEILVVDDGSTDGTAACLARRAGLRRHMLRQPRAGVAAARNTGIRRARGEFIAFTDDDCEVPPDWLREFDALFRAHGADLIGGSVENALPGLLPQFYQDMATHLYERQNLGATCPEFLSANNMAVRRETLLRGGLFDDRFFLGGEDRELVKRLAQGGARVIYHPALTIRHYHAFTLGTYARHCFRMGRGSYLLHRVIPREGRYTAARPNPRVYREFVTRLLTTPPAPHAPARLALFALAQASVALGFVVAALTGTAAVARKAPRAAADPGAAVSPAVD